MCQINVVFEQDGDQENVMEGVTSLKVTKEGVLLTTFFDEPLTVPDVVISSIDFLGGKVVLERDTRHKTIE